MNCGIAEQYLYEQIAEIFPDAEHRRFVTLKHRTLELDVFIGNLPLAIEYDSLHHCKHVQKDENKNYLLRQADIHLIRVREQGLPPLKTYGCTVIPHTPKDTKDLERCAARIMEEIRNRFALSGDTLLRMQNWRNSCHVK